LAATPGSSRPHPSSAYPRKAVQAGESAKMRVKFSPARGRVSPAFLRRSAATPGFPYAAAGQTSGATGSVPTKGVFRSSRSSVWPQAVADRDEQESLNINSVARIKKGRGRGHNTGFPSRPGKARKITMERQERNRRKKEHLPERRQTGTS